jgi:hypothetical protein
MSEAWSGMGILTNLENGFHIHAFVEEGLNRLASF